MLDRPLHIGTTLSRAPAISPAPLLRAVLVDDEPLALETLAMNLRRLGGVEILGRATNPFTGLEMVETLKPDLLFLDVRMPGLDGFEFASRLPSTDRPMIIFVTAHDNLGSRAFDEGATDYLCKPAPLERLSSAVSRARGRLAEVQSAASWRELNASPYGTKPLQSGVIWVRERHGKRRVPLSSVEQIVAEREYARLFTDDRTHLIRRSLSSLAEELSPQGFCRVHRSAIVNLGAVSGVVQRRGGGLAVQLASGAAAAIGPAFLPDFRRRL